ncbi:MAG TPA: phospholipid carrier-dependent glycosyltransferase [Deltaproteobacteria bacterium]|nr:phospholipid carrier-dependent glycosyltransferase [Deltaproteobacteria bacterium]
MNGYPSKRTIALCLSLVCCAVVALTLDDYGITWDEGSYVIAGRTYLQWLDSPSIETIDRFWSLNHEHPPLVKVMVAATGRLFGSIPFLPGSEIPAFRSAILIFVFVLTYALFSFASELYGRGIGILVALSFFFLPRVFFHSHLAALDYPLTALWFLVVYLYWKGMERGWGWIVSASVLLGLALLIKLTALFIYIPLVLCWIMATHERFKQQREVGKGSWLKRLVPQLWRLVPLFFIPPLVFVGLWPWLWENTLERLVQYVAFHADHFTIPVFYLGREYVVAPWHYPLVFLSATVPLIVLAPLLVGIYKSASFGNRKANTFILFNAFFPVLLLSLPGVPKYDGVRLFLPSFPFLCMVSGLGLKYLLQRFRGGGLLKSAAGLYLFLFVLSVYVSVIRTHPYQSSYFNEVMGGTVGASMKGFEHEYWGSSYLGTLGWLNRNSSKSFWLAMADIDPKARFPFDLYREAGLLDGKVRFTSRDKADYVILLIRQGFFDREMWNWFLNETPVFSVRLSDTLLVGIYRNRK